MCSSLSLKKTFAEGDGTHIRERHNMEYTMQRRRAQWFIRGYISSSSLCKSLFEEQRRVYRISLGIETRITTK